MKKLFFFISISLLFLSFVRSQNEIPVLKSDWWQITTTYPDISPYAYFTGDNKVCDFTIFQAEDESWQLIACIRGNTYPGSQRFLYRWETDDITNAFWEQKGIFWTTGIEGKEDATGRKLADTPFKDEGKLQAPHCFKHNNKYYMFLNSEAAYCLVSNNGKDWEYAKNEKGDYVFFDMGRDVMVLDDRENTGKWIAYYTDGSIEPQCVTARNAETLGGKWSDEKKSVYDGFTNSRSPIYPNEFAESPFVVVRNGVYYLFAQLHVFRSNDPYHFVDKITVLESTEYHKRAWAAEIIEDNKGNLYLAAYRPSGIWICRMKWISVD